MGVLKSMLGCITCTCDRSLHSTMPLHIGMDLVSDLTSKINMYTSII